MSELIGKRLIFSSKRLNLILTFPQIQNSFQEVFGETSDTTYGAKVRFETAHFTCVGVHIRAVFLCDKLLHPSQPRNWLK